MARYFAQLDKNNIVTNVVVIADHEAWNVLNYEGEWVETYMDREDKNYAGIGFRYDREQDAFIPPQPYPSWILNKETCLWDSPIPYPEDGGFYKWNEEKVAWVKATLE